MKIVIDTNVVASGVFFGGDPRKVIEAVSSGELDAYATVEITEEYQETVDKLLGKYEARFDKDGLSRFSMKLNVIEPETHVEICRDPDDDKFISCAVDSRSLYIVSGDKDLLTIGSYEDVEIITARDFCKKYLK